MCAGELVLGVVEAVIDTDREPVEAVMAPIWDCGEAPLLEVAVGSINEDFLYVATSIEGDFFGVCY